MTLIYNPMIYNDWNYKELIKSIHYDLYWTSAEIFRIPEKYDYNGELIQGTGINLASRFKLNYEELMNYLYIMVVEMHYSYQDFNIMPWYEITSQLNIHYKRIDESNKNNEQQQKQINQQMTQMKQQYNQNNFKMPKYELPKYNMPKI